MGDERPPPGNGGVVRWEQLTASNDRLRSDWRADIATAKADRDRQADTMTRRIDAEQGARLLLEERTDKLEQWRDRWLGPAIAFLLVLQATGIAVGVYAVLR